MPTLKSVKKKLSYKIDNLKVGEMILREEISTLKSDAKIRTETAFVRGGVKLEKRENLGQYPN